MCDKPTSYGDVLGDRQLDVSSPRRHVHYQIVQRPPVHLQSQNMFHQLPLNSINWQCNLNWSHLSEQFLYTRHHHEPPPHYRSHIINQKTHRHAGKKVNQKNRSHNRHDLGLFMGITKRLWCNVDDSLTKEPHSWSGGSSDYLKDM